jgi:hypothetical protein
MSLKAYDIMTKTCAWVPMAPIIKPIIVGLACFKSNRSDLVKKLPPPIPKLANYEYRNSKLSPISNPMGLITPTWKSPVAVEEETGEKKAILQT